MTLRARIAQALGWTELETQSFSFQTLREMVRTVNPKLAREITVAIKSGAYILGEPLTRTHRHDY